MSRQTKLKNALFTCISFTIIGFFNVGLYWEERSAVVEQVTWELQNQLTLSRPQTVSIKKIYDEFYDEVTNLTMERQENDKLKEAINKLITIKNKKIMKILNKDQQIKWLKDCSGKLENMNMAESDCY